MKTVIILTAIINTLVSVLIYMLIYKYLGSTVTICVLAVDKFIINVTMQLIKIGIEQLKGNN